MENKSTVENRKMKTGRGYFKEYCENTSIHGVHYLAQKRSSCERLLWTLLICTSLSACGYLISHIYNKYKMSPVIVTFATKESAIYTIPFPSVTICPMTKATKMLFNFTHAAHQKLNNESLSQEEELYGAYMSVACRNEEETFSQNETYTNDFYDKLDKLRIPQSELFFQCKFMDIEVNCSMIFKPIILDESICYSFNILDRSEIFRDNVFQYSEYHRTKASDWDFETGKFPNDVDSYPFRAFLAGYDNSLEITFSQNSSDLDYLCAEDVQGYSVSLHLPSAIPMLKRQYLQVPLDNVVLAAVKPKVIMTSETVRKFKPIVRQCYFSMEKHLKYFKFYNPDNCRFECLTNFSLRACECVHFYMPRDNSTPICGGAKLSCLTRAELNLKLTILMESEDEFSCDYKPLCTDIAYDTELSQTEWNYREQFRAIGLSYFDGIRFSKLSVYFKRESFLTSQRNELYGPIDFLANFGGLLGLFTGFSLLSLAEIIYFLTIRICCNYRLYRNWRGI